MHKIFYQISWTLLLVSCTSAIKDTEAQVDVEEGTYVADSIPLAVAEKSIGKGQAAPASTESNHPLTGYWVGYFEEDREQQYHSTKAIRADEYSWNRENKINISIDTIDGQTVRGHSVVAGNDRPFEGYVESVIDNATQDTFYLFDAREPGDDQYDGKFMFEIKNNQLTGTWQAYRTIDISRRKYTLERKTFAYDPNVMLEYAKQYIDWHTMQKTRVVDEYDGEVMEWFSEKFASASEEVYKINASNTLLDPSDVENLRRGDLVIIRNTIYARHGYSFKHRPLRVFFDAQPWYIPVHTDIKDDFTNIEKQNIQLLLRYEENAAEYYDYFGRG